MKNLIIILLPLFATVSLVLVITTVIRINDSHKEINDQAFVVSFNGESKKGDLTIECSEEHKLPCQESPGIATKQNEATDKTLGDPTDHNVDQNNEVTREDSKKARKVPDFYQDKAWQNIKTIQLDDTFNITGTRYKNGVKVLDCGCPHSCDAYAIGGRRNKGGVTCEGRIRFLMKKRGMNEIEACQDTSTNDHFFCGDECNPSICKDMKTSDTSLDVHDPPFQKYDGVVITTKVHFCDIKEIKRMFCLLKAAYNRFVNYDILVFTTIPWTDEEIHELAQVVAPAKLTVAIDGPPLEEQLALMTVEELDFLEKRCSKTRDKDNVKNITWFNHCEEKKYGSYVNLAYAWQSEFRAYHIWTHPALEGYKYQMWMDSDSLCTRTWEHDPMKVMIENNLTILYDNYPAGKTKGREELKEKMKAAYGKMICSITENTGGTWDVQICEDEENASPLIQQIHGFHHITNLDVYRKKEHQDFLRELVGDYRFSRNWDDQIGITIPAAMEAPERVWDLTKHNMTMRLRHNGAYDGKIRYTIVNARNWWIEEGRNWTTGRLLCDECVLAIY